ncbi:MAG: patatin-like phospholipase family protein [Alphaproteobacteria bacterium]
MASPKTAFVFAGGGSLGAIQVGMLHSLASHGVVADMACGSSVGAINAAYYAGNPTLEGIGKLETIWRGLRRQDVFPISLATLFGFIRRRDFLVTSEGLRKLIETHLPYRNLEDARIPIFIVATDIISAETVVLSKGPACDAILASTAIPAAFAPVQIEALYLADGAISSNTPINVAVANGAERLIVLPTGYACARQTPPVGAVANALHALTLLIARQLIAELDRLDPRVDYYVLPPLCPLDASPYDFSRTGELIARAIKSTDEWIDGGGLEAPRTHAQLSLHKHKPKH